MPRAEKKALRMENSSVRKTLRYGKVFLAEESSVRKTRPYRWWTKEMDSLVAHTDDQVNFKQCFWLRPVHPFNPFVQCWLGKRRLTKGQKKWTGHRTSKGSPTLTMGVTGGSRFSSCGAVRWRSISGAKVFSNLSVHFFCPPPDAKLNVKLECTRVGSVFDICC